MTFQLRPRDRAFMAAWVLALVSLPGCSEAARKRRDPAPAPSAASAPAPAAPAPSAPAGEPAGASAAPAAASAPALRRGLDPRGAQGKVLMQLSIATPIKLGGFAFTATYDPEKFHVAEPVTEAALQGYMCQANLGSPGTIRYNCAGLVNEARGGKLAAFEVSYATTPPTTADFTVTQSELVDDLAAKVETTRLDVAISPVPAR